MKNWVAKQLIDRAVDDNRDVPVWVADLMARDENLRAYEQSQRELVEQLRTDSYGWVLQSTSEASVAGGTPQVVRKPTFTGASIAALATAACVLVAAAWWFNRAEPESGPIAENPPVEPLEMDDVREAVVRGQDTVNDLSESFNDYAAIVPVGGPAEISEVTKSYVRQAGSVYGRGLAMLGGR